MKKSALSLLLLALAAPALADPPVIEAAQMRGGQIHVTVSHPDSGWDHYADIWRVYGPDGAELAERVLLHPHETEQPFTRSTALHPVEGTGAVTVVAGCTDGDLSEPFELVLGDGDS